MAVQLDPLIEGLCPAYGPEGCMAPPYLEKGMASKSHTTALRPTLNGAPEPPAVDRPMETWDFCKSRPSEVGSFANSSTKFTIKMSSQSKVSLGHLPKSW